MRAPASCAGRPSRRAADRRCDRRRREGVERSGVRRDAPTAISPTTRRRARKSGASTRRRHRTSPVATRAGAPDETRGADMGAARWIRPGQAPDLLGRGESDAEHARQPSRRQQNAIPTESPADLYSNSTIALDPARASCAGTTSTCLATTGTRTTPTSARFCAPLSIRIRSS